jgi:glyoxylase-like metal-dependent hydrolase (beta-lactamase superfamily II)
MPMACSEIMRLMVFPFVFFLAIAMPARAEPGPPSDTLPNVGEHSSNPSTPAHTTTPPTEGRLEGSVPRIAITEDLYVREVREGVLVITHSFPWAANSLLVEMESGDLVLVDTPYTPEAAQNLLDWIEAQYGTRAITAINTGHHCDNLGGNSCLIEQGIPVYGSSMTARLIAERGDAMRENILDMLQAPKYRRYCEAHQMLLYVPPTHLFTLAEGLDLRFGDESVRVFFPGPSHSPDNVVVHFPSRRVLFGGCMIIGWNGVGNTADADMQAWPHSVRKLFGIDVDLVVPGHGDRLDPGLLAHTIDLLAEHRE